MSRALKHYGALLMGLTLTLLLAPLATIHAAAPSTSPDRLPSFSWERVPRYMHTRNDTAFTWLETGDKSHY